MASNLSALDRLRKAANLEPIKKEVTLSDGSVFEMYVTPLTMAERERAQKQARSDDANAFVINNCKAKLLLSSLDNLCALSRSAIVNGLTYISKIEPSDNVTSFFIGSRFAAFLKRSNADRLLAIK